MEENPCDNYFQYRGPSLGIQCFRNLFHCEIYECGRHIHDYRPDQFHMKKSQFIRKIQLIGTVAQCQIPATRICETPVY